MQQPPAAGEAPADIDVHQHLWPPELIDRLRARSRPPYLRGWRLVINGERPYDLEPQHHDVAERVSADHAVGVGLAGVSLSAPLGIERLPRPEARVLLDAWHAGAARFPEHFMPWASVTTTDPDLGQVRALLAGRFVGLQLPASDLLSPAAWDRMAPVLQVVEEAGKPVFVHPGPVHSEVLAGRLPSWWAPVVGYTAQLQAAWWGWHEASVRASFPRLRVIFAAGAGLAPVHHERHAARGGHGGPLDQRLFVDTSSYGPQGLDALVRALSIDSLVLGSDSPYSAPADAMPGEAARRAVRHTNPLRALGMESAKEGQVRPWLQAS